jgi:hypothetical protein
MPSKVGLGDERQSILFRSGNKSLDCYPTFLTLVYGITKRDSSGYNRMNGVA